MLMGGGSNLNKSCGSTGHRRPRGGRYQSSLWLNRVSRIELSERISKFSGKEWVGKIATVVRLLAFG